jgi:glycosyltransferase involved in cell wall biosynthesis
MPFLSLCMIVKNEEKHLKKCLESVYQLVDEIIIVDTGSTDKTKEIAYNYTSNIIDFQWQQDFSAARNTSIQNAKGTWIIYLDADEFIDPLLAEDLLNFLKLIPSHTPTGIIVPVFNYVGDINSGKISESNAMRIFNNYHYIHFFRPIHEQLVSPNKEIQSIKFMFPVYHTGYLQEMIEEKNKSFRNMAIFNSMAIKSKLSSYDWFTLGNEYNALNEYHKAAECYTKANHPSQKDKSWLPHCLGSLINCHIHLEQFTQAYNLIQSSQQYWPNACDFYWLEGFLLAKLGLDNYAINSLITCLQLADRTDLPESDKVLISPNHGSSLPLQQLAVLYIRNFAYEEAVTCLSKLIYVSPNNQTLLKELIQILLSFHQTEGIETLLLAFYPEPNDAQLLLILEVCLEFGLTPLANHYNNLIVRKEIDIPLKLKLLTSLLNENIEQFNILCRDLSNNEMDTDIIYMSALIWHHEKLNLLPNLEAEVLIRIYMRFFHAQKYDYCDDLLNRNENTLLLNELGNRFFHNRQYELAMSYYSTLLNRDALSASGYENVGRLYIAQGDNEDGLDFIRIAINLNSKNLVLRTFLLIHLSNAMEKEQVKHAITEEYQGLKNFPLI